jgi:hypothetical protein
MSDVDACAEGAMASHSARLRASEDFLQPCECECDPALRSGALLSDAACCSLAPPAVRLCVALILLDPPPLRVSTPLRTPSSSFTSAGDGLSSLSL